MPIFFYQFSISFHIDASIKIKILLRSKIWEASKAVRNVVYRAVLSLKVVLYEFNIENIGKKVNFLRLKIILDMPFYVLWRDNVYEIIWHTASSLQCSQLCECNDSVVNQPSQMQGLL